MTFRRSLGIALLVCLPSFLPAQKPSAKFTNEAVVFSGAVLKPGNPITAGAGFGFGYGKNLVSFEVSGQQLNDYALGVGESFYPNLTDIGRFPVSRSHATDAGVSYRRDLISVHNDQFILYGSAGAGYVQNQFTVTQPCNILSCFPDVTLRSTTGTQKTWSFGPSAAAGVRIRLWRAVGIRGEVKYWQTNGGMINPGGRGYPNSTRDDSMVRATIGLYVHSKNVLKN